MQYNGLPLYNIVLDPETEDEGLSVVSIVSDPAVCEQLYCFTKDERKQFIFADETNEKHCITSVALLADCPIYRVDEFGNGYYVVFQKQTIRDLVEKYSKDGYNNLVSFQHNGEIVNDFIMLESYFVDKEKGLSPTQFDVPDGSWIITYKCTNNETWEKVKNELSTGGYSVEISCTIEPAADGQQIFDEPEDDFGAFLNELVKALEGLDCEIIMESDKDKWLVNGDGEYWLDENGNKVPAKCPKCGADVGVYIKGEPVFLCSECGEYLGTVKFPDDEMFSVDIKKKSEQLIIEDEKDDDGENDGHWGLNYLFAVERSDIVKNVKKSALINGKEYWIYGIGKRSGNDIAIAYDPEKRRYNIIPLEDIKEFEPTKTATGTFPALPESIVEDDEITVQKTIVSDDIPSILHSRTMAIINYNDEKPNPHTNARQIAIVAYGLTKAGNLAIRAYERFGDSRSAAEGEGVIPDYRMFLVKRIQSIKPMTGTQPWGRDLLDSRYNWLGDKGLPTLYEHITESDFN